MFERYTEKARRAIFFARYEASQQGSPSIEVDQLLLGLLREDKSLFDRLLEGRGRELIALYDEVRALRTPRERASTSVDLPLSDGFKHVLAYGAEEAQRLDHKHIDTPHLLIGVVREPSLAENVLREHDLTLDKLRKLIADVEEERASASRGSASSLGSIQHEFQMLTARLTHEIEPALIFRLP